MFRYEFNIQTGESVQIPLTQEEITQLEQQSVPPPGSVSMRQARLALLEENLLDAVETAILAISDPSQQKAAKIEWEYAMSVDRDSPFTQQLAYGLGLSSEQLDRLFIKASKL